MTAMMKVKTVSLTGQVPTVVSWLMQDCTAQGELAAQPTARRTVGRQSATTNERTTHIVCGVQPAQAG